MRHRLATEVARRDHDVHLQALEGPQRPVGLLGRRARQHLVTDDGVAAGRLHVLARLRAQPLPGPVHLLRRQPEDPGAAPHVDGAPEVQARGLRGVEDAGPEQRGRMGGQQALEMRSARLGETHVDDDPHVDIVPLSGPGVRDGPPRMA